ncbi:MAG: dihydrofolate reductase family protein, partial [Taibaiella sp.]|nr:dihydrofolate reductase family protein [Taibaiella sp.]
DQDYGLSEFFKRVDAVFYGRKSYELAEQMSAGGDGIPAMPEMKEYVFSNTLTQIKEGAVIVSGDIKEEVEKIKKEPGKNIWLFGGASLISSLMKLGLVDEIWLSIHPILLGSGKPLFTGITDRIPLQLIESKTYDTGLVSVKYRLAY